MLNLIFFLLGTIAGWFLKFAFDWYKDFKINEMAQAEKIDEILTNFKALEKLKLWDQEKKPKPL